MTIGQLLKQCGIDVPALEARLQVLEARLPSIMSFVADVIKALPAAKQRLNDAEQQVFTQMVEHGWFFNPTMDAATFFYLADLVNSKKGEELDRKMSDYFRGQLAAIETDLIAKNPDRGRILSEAFEAQRGNKYVLSIPVFLAQIDGISKELLGAEYFRYAESKNSPAKLIQQITGDYFLESALRALIPKGPMRASAGDRERLNCPPILNRHAVLHGEDLSYGTELNSLKAISLLNFMSEMQHLKKMAEVSSKGM
jgi:hypothetical protein